MKGSRVSRPSSLSREDWRARGHLGEPAEHGIRQLQPRSCNILLQMGHRRCSRNRPDNRRPPHQPRQHHLERSNAQFPSSGFQCAIGLLNHCETHGIAFMPWAPLGQNREANGALEAAARELGVTPLQVALAWLLRRSPVLLPIPGTSSVAHLLENVAAAGLNLPDSVFSRLSEITPAPASLRG